MYSTECCRKEWKSNAVVWQQQDQGKEVFSDPEVVLKKGGQLTVVWTGFENFAQIDSANQNAKVVPGGLSSGDPEYGGTFVHIFSSPGVFLFGSCKCSMWSLCSHYLSCKYITRLSCVV